MGGYVKFFDEKINGELARNVGYIKCLEDYKKSKDFVSYFKKKYPRLVAFIAGSITPASIVAQNWQQKLDETKRNELAEAESRIKYFWYDKPQKRLWEERYETTRLFYEEVERFVNNDLETARKLEKIDRRTSKNMAIIEKHVCRKVICDNIDAPQLKDLVDDLVSDKPANAGSFKGFVKAILIEEIEYAKLQENGKTNRTLAVIQGIKETTVKKKV